MKTYKIPGTPSVGLVRSTDKNKVVSNEEHEQYRTGVSMLLYLIKHTQPDISNSVRGLTRLNDGPRVNAMKEMKHIIKNVVDIGNQGLKVTPQKQ